MLLLKITGGALLGLVYVIVVSLTGAIVIIGLILYRTGQMLNQAIARVFETKTRTSPAKGGNKWR